MTEYDEMQSYLDSFISQGIDEKKARRMLKKESRRLFSGDTTLYEKYSVSDYESAMRKADRILSYLEGDILSLSGTDFTDVDVSQLTDTNEEDFVYSAKEKKESLVNILKKRRLNRKKNQIKDVLRNFFTYLCSLISIVVLVGIVYYCFSTGGSTLSWSFITGDYESHRIAARMEQDSAVNPSSSFDYPFEIEEGEAFSERWGVLFVDSQNTDGSYSLEITYVDSESPMHMLRVTNSGEAVDFSSPLSVSNLSLWGDDGSMVVISSTNDKANSAASKMDKSYLIWNSTLEVGGGGIRGPLIATLYVILFTLLFALPLGIGGAIYLSVYAKQNKLTSIVRTLIDMISGIPSIIFGLAGAIIFIPVFSGGTGFGSILSGAATLACMVLPTIMKNTEEAINVIPRSLKNASIALGASQTQTVFKVILPNSVPGILTGSLLAIGRIIGESAALVFACGTAILDNVSINTNSAATLAVYIWRVISGVENPNYKAASATAILILIVVLILNITVKLIASKLDKFSPNKKKSKFMKFIERKLEDRKIKKQNIKIIEEKTILVGGSKDE